MLTSALFAAKLYIIPISFPFLSPIERLVALQTSFGG